MVKQILEGGIYWLQMWVGTEQPVLETEFSEVRGWNGTWIGRVHAWMTSMNIRLSGGRPMAMLRHNDRAIVDLFEDEWEKSVVGEGNYILEKWRVSEMLHDDGTLAEGLTRGAGCQWAQELNRGRQQNVDKATGEVWRKLVGACSTREAWGSGADILIFIFHNVVKIQNIKAMIASSKIRFMVILGVLMPYYVLMV